MSTDPVSLHTLPHACPACGNAVFDLYGTVDMRLTLYYDHELESIVISDEEMLAPRASAAQVTCTQCRRPLVARGSEVAWG